MPAFASVAEAAVAAEAAASTPAASTSSTPALRAQMPAIPGTFAFHYRLGREPQPTNAIAYSGGGMTYSPPPAPASLDIHHLLPLPYFPFRRSWPVSELMRRAKQTRERFPGTPGGPPGSAVGKNFLPRVPNPENPDFNRRMARATEHLHSIVNSLIGSGQLVQTGQTSWEVQATATTTGLSGTFP